MKYRHGYSKRFFLHNFNSRLSKSKPYDRTGQQRGWIKIKRKRILSRIALNVINLTVTLGVWSLQRPLAYYDYYKLYIKYCIYINCIHHPLFFTQTRKRRQIGNDEWIRKKIYIIVV